MCGIAGTVFNRKFRPGVPVKREKLTQILANVQNASAKPVQLLDLAWQYKSNVNFLRYCKEPDERKFLAELSGRLDRYAQERLKELKALDKNESRSLLLEKYDECQQLLDSLWFFQKEIPKWYREILDLLKVDLKEQSDTTLVFLKYLFAVLNATSFLEIRGRDSFGLSLQFIGPKGVFHFVPQSVSGGKMESSYLTAQGDQEIATLIFKTANRIGSLGDNRRTIYKLLEENEVFGRILRENRFEVVSIMAHTRWASTGEVNLDNAHPSLNLPHKGRLPFPLVAAMMNGDIHNYHDILRKQEEKFGVVFDRSCSTDCLAIPAAFSGTHANFSLQTVQKTIKEFQGSYAIALQHLAKPSSLFLVNRGNQGLYLGLSYDHVMFASDVYGLIESCRYFTAFRSGSLLELTPDSFVDQSQGISILSLEGEKTLLSQEAFKTTTITTRDIDKKDYQHYLYKEILETKDITERTILGYLQSDKLIDRRDFHNAIVGDALKIPEKVIEKLVREEFREVIITGMGTCYTAAVAIAGYMRRLLRQFLPHIIVQPHVASEGSAFYLKPKMEDTLVIVIAQSGTTVDTNVFVQMAKDRGASSLAIVNKREGDVTFIVDAALYIGSGRDIEIAVPSTKTYTAQVVLGYILTLFLCGQLNRKKREHNSLLEEHLRWLRLVPELVDKTFQGFDRETVSQAITDFVRKHHDWYVAVDDSPNAVCGMEIRIKYSESCYQSLPYLHIDDLIRSRVKDSFITYVTNESLENSQIRLRELLNQGNRVVVILSFERIPRSLQTFIDEGRLLLIRIPPTEPFFSFIPTILSGQLLSYYAALRLDERKEYFRALQEIPSGPTGAVERWRGFKQVVMEGHLNQGFTPEQVFFLKSFFNRGKGNAKRKDSQIAASLSSFLEEMYELARRPIDTIKHQAKTITVGAVRQNNASFGEPFSPKHPPLKTKQATKWRQLFQSLAKVDVGSLSQLFRHREDIFIHPYQMDESFGYYAVNYLNSAASQFGIPVDFHLAQSYDVFDPTKNGKGAWLIVHEDLPPKPEFLKPYFPSGNARLVSIGKNSFLPTLNSDQPEGMEVALSFFCFSQWVLKGLLESGRDKEWEGFLNQEIESLAFGWEAVQSSRSIRERIRAAVQIFLERKNWKLLGSGVNYNLAKLCCKTLIGRVGRSCAFDVLENHKHIDISAEAAVFVVIANSWNSHYQNDVFAEVEKLLSHNNAPVILTHEGDNRFDGLVMKFQEVTGKKIVRSVPVIKIPRMEETTSFLVSLSILLRFVESLQKESEKTETEGRRPLAFALPSEVFGRRGQASV